MDDYLPQQDRVEEDFTNNCHDDFDSNPTSNLTPSWSSFLAEEPPASNLEKLVRIYRRCETQEELEKERKATNQRHFTRYLSHFWDEDGCLVIKASLPPEQGAIILKALEAATDQLREDERFDPWQGVDADGKEQSRPVDKVEMDAVDVSAETLSAGIPPEECCEKATPDTAGNNPQATGNSEDKPDYPLKTESTERRTARRVDALALLARDWLNNENPPSKNADRYQVVVNIDADVLAHKTTATAVTPEKPSRIDHGLSCYIEDMQALPVETVRRISCDCGVLGVITKNQQPLSVGRKTRTPTPAIRRAMLHRDHGCTFPGCCATRFLEAHHLTHWIEGGLTSLINLTLLCPHHHQLVHEGGYSVIRNAEGILEFYDDRGRYIDPKQAQPDDIDYRFHVHRLQSFGIDEYRLWSYCGDRMDYDTAIDGLISKRDKARISREQQRDKYGGSIP